MKKISDGLTNRERYLKKIKKVQIEINTEADKDIYEQLEKVPSKATYIKDLIRADIAKKNN